MPYSNSHCKLSDNCIKCMHGVPHAPLLVAYSRERGTYAHAAESLCVARWATASRRHAEGDLCGEPAAESIAGIDLCAHHARVLVNWRYFEEPAERTRQETRKLREARRDHERALVEDDAYRERALAKRSVIYYVRRTSDGMIKIGTSASLATRLGTLRREHGELQLLLICGGMHAEEYAAHGKFRAYRMGNSEWFRPARPLLEWIWRARRSGRYAGIQPERALPAEDLRKLVTAAPRRKDLRWEDDVLVWPPDAMTV